MGVITIIKPDGSTAYTVRPTHAYMGTCSTAKATAAKTVTITPAIDNFLEAGVRITVYFSIANTAANPTLSINSGTAKAIYKGSSAITAGLLTIGYHDFIYDGTHWQYVSSYINSNTTYNNLSASNTNTSTRYTVLGAGSNTAKFLRGDGSWQVPANTEYHVLDSEHFDAQEPLVVYGPGSFDHHLFLNGEGTWSTPQDTTYANVSASNTTTNASYTVPGAGSNTAKFLRGDGSWQTPSNTTYTTFTTAAAGLTPASGSNTAKFLRGDGTWQTPTDIDNKVQQSISTTSNYRPIILGHQHGTAGFDPTEEIDITYINKSISASPATGKILAGGYIISGAATNAFVKADGTAAVPTNTTYSTFTTAAAGLTPASGSNTAKFLRGDGSWQTPANTTYTTFTTAAAGLAPTSPGGTAKYLRADGSWQTPANTTYTTFTTAVNGLVPKPAAANTAKFLRGDGSWQAPSNTTYEVLSSSSTSNGSYVVNGVGDSAASTKYFLRGDGKWTETPATPIPQIMQGYAVGQNKDSNTEVDTIYYEYSRHNDTDDANIRNIIFRDKDDTELLANSLVDNHVYYFVFRNGLPSSRRIVLTDTQTYNQISFLRDETSNHWLQRGQDDFSLFPTHIVVSFKKIEAGLVYLGPVPVINMLSNVNTYGGRGYLVPGAGAHTGDFLRGDGSWQTPANTTYTTFTTAVNGLVPKPAAANTAKFLRGDGSWQAPSNTTYARISASNTTTNASYTVPGAGANTGYFLRGDGTWHSVSGGTDMYVLQTPIREDTYRPILMGFAYGGSGFTPTEVTEKSYVTKGVYINSQRGYVISGGFVLDGTTATNVYLKANGSSGVIDTFTANSNGLVPASGTNTGKFLRGDGTWQTVGGGGGTSYSTLTASDHASGTDYVVNGSGTNTGKFLRGDGTWQTPSNTTYGVFNGSNNGLVPIPNSGQNNAKYILSGDGTWMWYNGSAYMAKDEYSAMAASETAELGTVLPIDHYGRTNYTPYLYEAEGENSIQVLVPAVPKKIQYAIAVGMDDAGHLFIPITQELTSLLTEQMGYSEKGKG